MHDAHLPLKQNWRLDDVRKSSTSAPSCKRLSDFTESNDSLSKRVLAALTAQDMICFKSDLDRECTLNTMLRAYRDYDGRDISLEDASQIVAAYRELVRKGCIAYHRRVFYSEDSLVGLGPDLVQENDLICILHGLKVPIIPRKKMDGFEVCWSMFL